MCTYICIYTFTYPRTCTCTQERVWYTCIYECTYTCVYIQIYTPIIFIYYMIHILHMFFWASPATLDMLCTFSSGEIPRSTCCPSSYKDAAAGCKMNCLTDPNLKWNPKLGQPSEFLCEMEKILGPSTLKHIQVQCVHSVCQDMIFLCSLFLLRS